MKSEPNQNTGISGLTYNNLKTFIEISHQFCSLFLSATVMLMTMSRRNNCEYVLLCRQMWCVPNLLQPPCFFNFQLFFHPTPLPLLIIFPDLRVLNKRIARKGDLLSLCLMIMPVVVFHRNNMLIVIVLNKD